MTKERQPAPTERGKVPPGLPPRVDRSVEIQPSQERRDDEPSRRSDTDDSEGTRSRGTYRK